MPQFHETGYGKRFFDGQLPALTRALEKIGDNLAIKQPDQDIIDALGVLQSRAEDVVNGLHERSHLEPAIKEAKRVLNIQE